MKRLINLAFFLFLLQTASSQIIHFETGKLISSLKYKNSAGTVLQGLKVSNQNNIGAGARFSLFYSPWHVSCDASYNRYFSKGSDPVLGNYYEWDFTNLGVSLGIEYEFFKPAVNYNEQHGFSMNLKIAGAVEFLLDGTQNLNNQLTDLNGVEEFDKPFYFLKGGVTFNYYISKTYLIFLQYTGGMSFLIGSYNNQEQFRLVSHNVSLGVAVNLFHLK